MLGSRLDEHLAGHGRWAVGLMAGTSLDGVDAALVEIAPRHPRDWRLEGFVTTALDHADAARLRAAAEGEPLPARDLGGLAVQVALDHETAVRAVCAQARLAPEELGFVAAHGVTLSHDPRGDPPHSWQILDGSTLAARLGVVVVDDFRAADVALAGQGAPLAPVADLMLRASAAEDRVILNLGGIANVSLLGAGVEDMRAVVGADVGPANLPLDILHRRQTAGAEEYDAGGEVARAGRPDADLVRAWLGEEWVRRPPPRSFGREEFGGPFVDRFVAASRHLPDADRMATLVALETAAVRVFLEEVAGAWRRRDDRPVGVYVTGGGRHNRAVMEALARVLPRARVEGIEALGVPADAKEAFDFVVLGWLCLQGRSAGLAPVSGARRNVILGTLHPPALVE